MKEIIKATLVRRACAIRNSKQTKQLALKCSYNLDEGLCQVLRTIERNAIS